MTKRHTNNGLRKVCGCPRRTWAKCAHGWYFNFKPRGGQAYRFSLDKHFGRHIDSKSEAEDLAADLRKAIRAGKFGTAMPRDTMTLRQLADTYLDRYVSIERSSTKGAYLINLNSICRTELPRPTGGRAAFGEWRLTDIVTDTIERFREVRRTTGSGVFGVNRNLAALRAVFNWAVKVGYLDATPFKRHAEPVVRLADEPTRSRRLDADVDEERAVLAACGPHLHAVVVAALETGMRRGEILSLQWRQVEGLKLTKDKKAITWAPRAEIVLPWTKTKTRRDRRIPISTRLRAVLEMRRFDPDGEPLGPDAYVFGNELGQRVLDVKRAWSTAVLKAHGWTPKYSKTSNFDAATRAELDRIDLHLHDLRREAGSRWLEGGVPLHTIRDWLGHTSIAQTSTYLAGTMKTQHDAMREFEARRASLQGFATNTGSGDQNGPRSTESRDGDPNETGVGREPVTM